MAGRVWIKLGVCGDLQPVARKGLGRVALLYANHGKDLFVTSIREANHSPGSLHYDGYAFDIQHNGVPTGEIRKALGAGWDVVESNDGAVHCEYDPKER